MSPACRLPYGITQRYLLPDTSEYAPLRPALTPARGPVLGLLTPEGWKAELVHLGYPAMHRPETELAICRSLVRRPNHYTILF